MTTASRARIIAAARARIIAAARAYLNAEDRQPEDPAEVDRALERLKGAIKDAEPKGADHYYNYDANA